MIDETDRQILDILQKDARTSNAEVARRVGMAPSAVFERIRKLEERGVITGYTARLDPHALGLGLLAFVFVRSDEKLGAPETEARLAEIPEAQEVHHIAGEDCFLVKVRASDTESLGRLLRERFGAIPTLRSTKTTIVLQTIKETLELPNVQRAASAEEDTEKMSEVLGG
jgi:Lrp/AsnC family transcriptional regulator, leucine-responsive regulatory protein